jgi:hypothetical protein
MPGVAGMGRARDRKFADSTLEGDGFKLLVPGRETIKPSSGGPDSLLKTAADLSRDRKFESVSLRQRVFLRSEARGCTAGGPRFRRGLPCKRDARRDGLAMTRRPLALFL